MYKNPKYRKESKKFIFEFIKAHPFATFILNGNRILATHIPILLEGDEENFRLYAHIADNNEQYPYLKDELDALLIFKGADSYVSSSWYKEKNISTWDYSAVHINVKLKIQSKAELEDSLKNLVEHFEKDQENPLFYNEIPQEMIKDHLPRITGFWCEPVKIDAIAKLHQGYEKEDIKRVADHLESKNDFASQTLSKNIRKEHDL